MIARPYWINTQLAIVLRPRGDDWLDNEMLALRAAGIDVVVSLLEMEEAAKLGLQQESDAAGEAGLSFVRFSIPDHRVPLNLEEFNKFLSGLERHLSTGKRIGIHCQACIGRSSVVAVSLLIRSGVPHEAAWNQVTNARGYLVPDTDDQMKWVNLNIRANARG
jgi:protein-tyrosine phosphatase